MNCSLFLHLYACSSSLPCRSCPRLSGLNACHKLSFSHYDNQLSTKECFYVSVCFGISFRCFAFHDVAVAEVVVWLGASWSVRVSAVKPWYRVADRWYSGKSSCQCFCWVNECDNLCCVYLEEYFFLYKYFLCVLCVHVTEAVSNFLCSRCFSSELTRV